MDREINRSRRRFVRNIFAGGAGVALGGITLQAMPADAFFHTPAGARRSANPVFPFMKYMGQYNFGDYIPKDQGGKFIQMELLGTEDDAEITRLIRGGVLRKVYGDPIGWGRYEQTEIEKSVWLNRFYFLPSFARMYHLTGDRSYLDEMMQIVRRWIDDNPRLPDSHRTTYNWRDMQVAWRSIHYSWCWYLAGDGLTGGERELIIATLREHAFILLTGFGQAKLNEFNHQSHGGLAMLYLGLLFPMLDESEELVSKGMTILNHHIANAFYADGGNVEQMFGYYPFQAHLFRDAYLLCTANGVEPPAGSLPALRRMATFLTAMARPDGTMPQVNDSYEMPAGPIVDTINDILGDSALTAPAGSHLFPDTQVGVMRQGGDKGWYLLANPASVIGAHAHAGRLGFELWHNGVPLLTESGCCNYDDPALVTWYRTTRAHNSVVIDGVTEAATSTDRLWVPRRETPNRITGWEQSDGVASVTMVSPPEEATNASVRWSRTITLVGSRMAVISDLFESDGRHSYEILLHFPPAEVTTGRGGQMLMMQGSASAEIHAVTPHEGGAFTLTNGMVSMAGRSTEAPMAAYAFNAAGNSSAHMLVVPLEDERPPVITTRRRKGVTEVTVRHAGGRKTRLALGPGSVRIL